MTKPIVYFDFDNTLLNVPQLLENIAQSFSSVGISSEQFYAQSEQYSKTLDTSINFNPEDFLQSLAAAHPGKNIEGLSKLFYQESNYTAALFPDVEHVIPRLSQVANLGIYSQGVPAWQKTKLEKSGLVPYFQQDKIIIELNKLDATVIDRLEKNSYLVDDRADVVELVKHISPTINAIQIVRDGQDHNDQHSISSLTEIAALVTKELQ